MTLALELRHRLGAFTLNVAFSGSGRLTVLFGPSGSGKTSLINLIAGLERPDEGRIEVEGRILVDTARGIFLPPHKRGIGYVFQDGRLFPHLTVRGNLTYGRWFTPPSRRNQSFNSVIELLGIEHLLKRLPGDLSGGEKSRVAIGRAMLASPRLLLMDEPLAALDEARKAEVLPFVERLRDETQIPIVYVSHSVAEVRRLATTIVVLDAGRVVALGAPEAVMQRMDLFPLAADSEPGVDLDTIVERHEADDALTVLSCAAGYLFVPRIDTAVGAPVRLRIRAREVLVATSRPRDISALNIIPASVAAVTTFGEAGVDITLDAGGIPILARMTQRSVLALGLEAGRPCFAIIKSVSFERGSGIGPTLQDRPDCVS